MNYIDKRSEPRTIVNKYYSVQFSLEELDSIYQFILWDISPHGLCILIEKESYVLSVLGVGDVFRMKYYPHDMLQDTKWIKTKIQHITTSSHKLKAYCMVGLSILEKDAQV